MAGKICEKCQDVGGVRAAGPWFCRSSLGSRRRCWRQKKNLTLGGVEVQSIPLSRSCVEKNNDTKCELRGQKKWDKRERWHKGWKERGWHPNSFRAPWPVNSKGKGMNPMGGGGTHAVREKGKVSGKGVTDLSECLKVLKESSGSKVAP